MGRMRTGPMLNAAASSVIAGQRAIERVVRIASGANCARTIWAWRLGAQRQVCGDELPPWQGTLWCCGFSLRCIGQIAPQHSEAGSTIPANTPAGLVSSVPNNSSARSHFITRAHDITRVPWAMTPD
jgi:hypothetical protein